MDGSSLPLHDVRRAASRSWLCRERCLGSWKQRHGGAKGPVSHGRYEIIRRLALGGMAEVFLARVAGPQGFTKTLVLKQILPNLAEDQTFVKMFLSEARLAAMLSHPNIVQIFDFGETNGTYFLAMEYVEGPDLRAIRKFSQKTQRPVPFNIATKIISEVCQGLGYAHEFRHPDTGEPLNLVHRDLSPDNILVSESGSVKVLDFGIAKASGVSEVTRSRLLKGKFAYMSPEQVRGDPLDARSDLFALGVVFYEILTGKRPFDGTEPGEPLGTMHSVLHEEPRPPSELRPDLPDALDQILFRALRKKPEQRYQSCRELKADLDRFLASRSEPTGGFELAEYVQSLELSEISTSKKVRRRKRESQPPPPQAAAAPTLLTAPSTPEPLTVTRNARASRSSRRTAWLLLLSAFVAVLLAIVWLMKSPSPARPEPIPPVVVERPPEPAVVPEPLPPPEPVVEAAPPKPIPKRTHRPARTPAPAPPTRAPVARHPVEFRVRPYAQVFVDGVLLGDTPLRPIQLTEGLHTVRLKNTELKKDVEVPLRVRPGPNVFRHNLIED